MCVPMVVQIVDLPRSLSLCPYRLQTSNFGQRVPLVYARGNHDGPSDGPVSAYLAGRYFAFTAGPVRWVVLDANDDSPQQFKWCEKEVSGVFSVCLQYCLFLHVAWITHNTTTQHNTASCCWTAA